jgi:hypothetical protein
MAHHQPIGTVPIGTVPIAIDLSFDQRLGLSDAVAPQQLPNSASSRP